MSTTDITALFERLATDDCKSRSAHGDSASSPAALVACAARFGRARFVLYGGASFQPSEALKAMTWFEGGDLHTLPSAVRQTLIGHAAQPLHLPASMLQAETLI